MPFPSHNTPGLANTSVGQIPAVIEYCDTQCGFLFVRSHDGQLYRIHHTQFQPMPKIPPRHREYVFSSVAHIWQAALAAFPAVVTADPGAMSLDTLMRKLRDSREAKNLYGWTSPLVNEAQWQEKAERVIIAQDLSAQVLLLGARENLRSYKHGSMSATIKGQTEVAFEWTTFSQVEQLCFVTPFMTPRQIFVVKGLSEEQRASLEARYDVGVIKIDEVNTQII